jgi:hypothetical protein
VVPMKVQVIKRLLHQFSSHDFVPRRFILHFLRVSLALFKDIPWTYCPPCLAALPGPFLVKSHVAFAVHHTHHSCCYVVVFFLLIVTADIRFPIRCLRIVSARV